MAGPQPKQALRVLFLCTGNSAHSQIAEALLGTGPVDAALGEQLYARGSGFQAIERRAGLTNQYRLMYHGTMTKTSTPTDAARVARWFHALSDETRVRVVELLCGGEQCVCDLQAALDAAQSRLSFHLKVLREAGLVNDRKDGRWVHYSLRPEVLEEMAQYLQAQKPLDTGWSACACGSKAAPCC